MPPAVVVIVLLLPIMPIAMPIDDELLKPDQFVPFTPATKLLAMVRLLLAVPVPTVIPRPPYPPLFVFSDFVMMFLVTVEDTNPVSSEIAVGDCVVDVCWLTVFCAIELFSALPTSMPMLAKAPL